ncbi:WbuC family cupin fold metalloprotein [Desulfurispira natronophila]|uniref:Cupin fold WbuC family metalloprotein n=1 Tax=Desulfurispira natronophila TaxID=682562 RepID=A0A7W7Y551_9BACT|nr:WbuC family cupin fold metalloprotein [Desulfurispira natronophila]MBB5022177.1 cupin fold WbuC family metalloprotein [Desulfurispira natronophila]
MKRIDVSYLSTLVQQAQSSSLLRHIETFTSSRDHTIRRFLHALEPGSYLRPVSLSTVDKVLLCLQGKVLVATFTEEQLFDEVVALGADLPSRGLEISAGTCHCMVALESASVLYESHYGNLESPVEAPWAPEDEDESSARHFRHKVILAHSKEGVLGELLSHGLMERYFEHKTLTRTSLEAAEALGVDVGQIAKSIVLMSDDGEAVIVVLAGDRRVDLGKVRHALGKKFRIATPEQTLATTGYLVGSVSPFAILEPSSIYIDVSLRGFSEIYPAAGSTNNGFRTTFRELTDILGFPRCDFAKEVVAAL